jgi:ABC-type multidrug transport system fused ATPase/permease subunit
MNSVLQGVWRHLSKTEKTSFELSLIARLALVALDLAGVALIGIAVAVATGTKTTSTSFTGQITKQLTLWGVINPYALIAVLAIVFFAVKAVSSILLNRYLANFVARLEGNFSDRLYSALMSSDLETLDRYSQSNVSYALVASTAAAFNLSITAFSIVFGEMVMILGLSTYLLTVDPLLFLILAIYLGLVGVLMNILTAKKNRLQAKKLAAETMKAHRIISDSYLSFRQITMSANRQAFESVFADTRKAMASAQAEISILNVLPRYLTEIALMTGLGLILMQRLLVEYSSISAATIAIFVAGSFRIIASLLPLQGSINLMRQTEEMGHLSLKMLEEFRYSKSAKFESMACENEPSIKIENIGFVYGNGKIAFQNFSLEIPFGSKVLIRGASGTGKSTLLDLLLGLREPQNGLVRIAGLSPAAFRAHNQKDLGYVSQSAPLIEGTLAQNITLDLTNLTGSASQLDRTIRDACLEELVSELPLGINTEVRPGLLSGGQTQRIAIARAILHDPSILILDEATSALDPEVSNRVLENIFLRFSTSTVIVVSHNDIETLRWDKILEI